MYFVGLHNQNHYYYISKQMSDGSVSINNNFFSTNQCLRRQQYTNIERKKENGTLAFHENVVVYQ